MKFQKIVIALLALLLGVNTIGVGVVIQEEKEQTEIALYTAAMTKMTGDAVYMLYNHMNATEFAKYYGGKALNIENYLVINYPKIYNEIQEVYNYNPLEEP